MPPYDFLATQSLVFMCGVGLLVTLAIVLARSSGHLGLTGSRKSDEDLAKEAHEFAGGVSETNRPVPWLIWLVFVGYFLWAVGYVIFSGAVGL